jgi:hypothetical protein
MGEQCIDNSLLGPDLRYERHVDILRKARLSPALHRHAADDAAAELVLPQPREDLARGRAERGHDRPGGNPRNTRCIRIMPAPASSCAVGRQRRNKLCVVKRAARGSSVRSVRARSPSSARPACFQRKRNAAARARRAGLRVGGVRFMSVTLTLARAVQGLNLDGR